MILSFISLHPLFMGFFNGIEVLNCYNKLSEEERASIFNHYQRDPTQRPDNKKNILSYTINNYYYFSDISKRMFKERYAELYEKYSDKLNKYFNIVRCLDEEMYIKNRFNSDDKLYKLV